MNHIWIFLRRATFVALLFLANNILIASVFNVRALWVVRDHVINKESIDRVLMFAENNNYNHLFVQIRGRGDAYYNSRLVPRSHLLKDTDFDPLQYILKKAKGTSIKIHAWLNVYKKMQFNFHFGLLLGLIGVGFLSVSVCK